MTTPDQKLPPYLIGSKMEPKDITLARVHGDYHRARRVRMGLEKKSARVRDRVKSRRELHERAAFLWIFTGKLDWTDVARSARRIAYLAEGFSAEERLPSAIANEKKHGETLDAVRKEQK